MIRYFFFILVFPPAFMDLLLVQAHPAGLARYMIAGYVLVTLPAAAIAVTDEMLAGGRDVVRTLYCGLAGLLLSPLVMSAFGGMDLRRVALTAACGGIAAFLCAVVFVGIDRPRRARAVVSPA